MARLIELAAHGGTGPFAIALGFMGACSGVEFTPPDNVAPNGGSSAGTAPKGASGGSAPEPPPTAGSGAFASGGNDQGGSRSTGGGTGGTGLTGGAGTGGAADAGSSDGGSPVPVGFDCIERGGQQFGQHCYIEKRDVSWNADIATSECHELGLAYDRNAYLLVIDSAEEQDWILSAWVAPTELTSDIWLGLRCQESEHPDAADCGCFGCDEAARANWSWSSDVGYAEGWKVNDPDGDGRCAALFTDPLTGTGWVDRDCAATSVQQDVTRTYRVICEIEQ
jgi:hypothetical protein